METKKRRHFPESLKRQAVERVLDSGLPIVRVAKELGLHETLLRRWMKRLSAPSPARRPATQVPFPADLAAENARLKRELSRAQMERDILKKSRAHLRGGRPVTYRFVDEYRRVWPVRMICHALGVSPSGYYA